MSNIHPSFNSETFKPKLILSNIQAWNNNYVLQRYLPHLKELKYFSHQNTNTTKLRNIHTIEREATRLVHTTLKEHNNSYSSCSITLQQKH